MRRLMLALSLTLASMVAPVAVSAAPGACAVSIAPSPVDEGATFTVTASGYTPNGTGLYRFNGYAASETTVTFDAAGALTLTEVATKPLTGDATVQIFDSADADDGSCDATATVEVVGDCSVTVEPSSVYVGQSLTIRGVDFYPNGDGFETGLLTGGDTALIQFDEGGSYVSTHVAEAWQVGHGTVSLSDGACGDTAALVILALPQTDTLGVAGLPGDDSRPVTLAAVLLASLTLGWFAVSRRRRRLE